MNYKDVVLTHMKQKKQFSTILDNSRNAILLNFIVKLVNQCFMFIKIKLMFIKKEKM